MRDLAYRFPQNPILTPADIRPSTPGMEVTCLLNPGVFVFEGKTWLLLRVAERPRQTPGKTSFPVLNDRGAISILEFDNNDPKIDLSDPRIVRYDGRDYLTTMSHLRLVSSTDGVHFSEPDWGVPMLGRGELETFGIEDCRVTQIDAKYCLTYTAVSENGVGIGLMTTSNWHEFAGSGMILPPHNKDCAIFEEKINGLFYALHRPSSPELGGNYIWIAESPDLLHWGNHRCIARTRPGSWDSARVGAGAAPIRTDRGWLEIYHGATREHRYCLGALLLDLEQPWKVIGRSIEPIMEPFETYECSGFFGEVIFTNGHLRQGDDLTVYYGASDLVICAARFSITAILDTLTGPAGGRG
jgi:predicted GH43/DUF377 family glycosyl hydrolase